MAYLAQILALVVVTFFAMAAGYLTEREDWVVFTDSHHSHFNRSLNVRSEVLALGPGGVLKLATYRMQSGRKMSLAVLEGHFDATGIEPADQWKMLGLHRAVLVNSVDEHESVASGLSGLIISGCEVKSTGASLRRDDVHIVDCMKSAPYSRLGIKSIANAAVVTWQTIGENEPCVSTDTIGGKDKEDCIERSVRTALGKVFVKVQEIQPDALIIPAVGTGIGGLTKIRFYKVVEDLILAELNKPSGYLPQRIYLHLWTRDLKFNDASFAIGDMAEQLENSWASQHPRITGSAYFISGGASAVIAIALLAGLRRRATDVTQQEADTKDWKFVFGWLLAAISTGMGVQQFLAAIAQKASYLPAFLMPIFFGVFGAVVSGYLVEAADRFKKGRLR